jgi:hypothetical protein
MWLLCITIADKAGPGMVWSISAAAYAALAEPFDASSVYPKYEQGHNVLLLLGKRSQ